MVDQTIRDANSSKTVEIVEEHGSFLLIRAAPGFAVLERRNGRIYPIAQGERQGVPMTAEAVSKLGGSSTSSANAVSAWLSLCDRTRGDVSERELA
jgi:hypothetical protein